MRSFLPLWLLVLAAPIGVGAQDTIPFLVRVEDRGRVTVRDRIVIRDPRTGADREIFRTPHAEGHIPYQVTVSPDGRYLAFIEVVSQTGAGEIRLTVIDRSGRIVRLLGESSIHAARGIREHLWCCGPHILAILVGTLSPFERPSGESSSLPPGLSLIDLRTGSTVAHVDGLRFPEQLHWAGFDSSIYIKDVPNVPPGTRGPVPWPIYRYHVPTGRLTQSAHVGVFFSPDGRYYFDRGVREESSSFQLYRTDNDQDVTATLAVPRHHIGPEGGWLPGADHTLVFIEKALPRPLSEGPRRPAVRMAPGTSQVYPDRWNLLVDAETGQVIERFQGDIGAGWKSYPPRLPVERRDGVELLPPLR